MPTYNYSCSKCGVFEKFQKIKDHARADCPTCGSESSQVHVSAPTLDIEGMADAGCPGALETSGDRMTKRHMEAGQGEPGIVNR